VGKTTTTSNIGVSIARLGYRVGLIDADIGLRNLDLLLGLENRVLYTGMEVCTCRPRPCALVRWRVPSCRTADVA
jgi:septum site-determining protein MinD